MRNCLRCRAELEPAYKACPHCGEPVTDFVRRYATEPIDGKYELVQRLGAGGMGDVYKVRHTFLNSDRVIKVVRAQISGVDADNRFLHEARMATKVQHPNVATLHDFSALPDGAHYMVWEFIDGENLAQLLRRRGTLPARYAIRLTLEALQGLEAIHRAGIVHRDISPENLMITRDEHGDEHVKIIDLGVAKFDDADHAVTKTGIFVGKLRYASPEQLGFLGEGEKIDGRADLYALAIVLYEMLTGRPPFEATSPHQYILHHSEEAAMQRLTLPAELPGGAALQQVLARALEPNRAKRFANAREFAAALSDVEPQTAPPFDADATVRVAPSAATMAESLAHTAPQTMPRTMPRAMPQTEPQTMPQSVPRPIAATPASPPAAPTLIEAPRRKTSYVPLVVLALIVATAAGAAFVVFRRDATPAPAKPVLAAATAPAVPASTNVNVVAPPTQSAAPPPTTTTAAPAPLPAPVAVSTHAPEPQHVQPAEPSRPEPQPQPRPAPQPEVEPAPVSSNATYIEGGEGNDEALASLQRGMRGVHRVAVEGSGDPMLTRQLAMALRRRGFTVVMSRDNPDATIEFNGTLIRFGRGRKERAAHATVTRGGRTIFRYELPAEAYRIGDNPAEAFARIFGDAIE